MATTQSKVNWYCQNKDYHSLNELKAFAKELIKSYIDFKAFNGLQSIFIGC